MDALRLIQAGVSKMGGTWRTSAVKPSADFVTVAIVDIDDAALVEAGEHLGVPADRRFKDLPAALDVVEADALLTVTPPPLHAVHAKLAFERGLHVLTEKPITDTMESARAMVAAASAAGRQLVVAQNYRFSPGARMLRDLLREAPLGSLGHGHIDFYIPGDFGQTFRGQMEFPLLVDMSIHHLDLIRSVTGRDIVSVVAQSFRPSWSWYRHDPGLKMLLRLEGDVFFSYSGDWSAYGRPTSWNGDWRLQCEQGCITWEDDQLALHRSGYWRSKRSSELLDIPGDGLHGQARLLADFATAIRTGTPAETSGQDNLNSFAAVMAAVQSVRENREVHLAGLMA